MDTGTIAVLADLFEKGGSGRLPMERAAFLVRDGERCRCLLWPFTGQFQQTSYVGAVPAAAFAVAHTHPNGMPNPSVADRALARRLELPVVVVTARRVSAAIPGEKRTRVLLTGTWRKGAPDLACEEMGESATAPALSAPRPGAPRN